VWFSNCFHDSNDIIINKRYPVVLLIVQKLNQYLSKQLNSIHCIELHVST
jgi:hypothetical protein